MTKTIEDCLTLSVTGCKRMGFFTPNDRKAGVITWKRGEKTIAALGFGTDLTGIPVAVLSYSYKGKPVYTTIPLQYHHSNLTPDAGYYYFVCPETGRYCRKLYLHDGRFVSRHALRLPYDRQTKSKGQRSGLLGYVRAIADLDKLTSQKYRRYTYNGNITPYGRKVERLERKCDSLDRAVCV